MKNTANSTLPPSQFGKELLNIFLQTTYVKNNVSTSREATYILNRLMDKSFKIAVVGEFSSGKSTFLNAIIGRDYLTHGVKETTAAVTMLVNTEKEDFGCITFSDGTIKTLKDYNQLKEVTTTQSTAYQVSSQIDLVELYIPFMDTKIPVVLLDTPGLNGVAAMHRERTIDIIQGVHACIYMLQSRGIGETDKKALQWIGQYQQELIIVQNFIDDINKSEGDTLDNVLNKQREILSETVFVEQKDVNYIICGVSAMKALAAKDTSIERLYSTDTVALSDLDRQILLCESNFEPTMNSITEFMESGFGRAQISALHSVYNLFERTARIMNDQFEVQNALWLKSDDIQIVQRTQQLLENWELRQAENEKKLDNFIVSKMNEGRRLAVKKLRCLIEEMESSIPNVFSKITTPEEWDAFNDNKVMELAMADYSIRIKHNLEVFLAKCCENTHNLAIQRIQEFAGLTDVFTKQSLPRFQVKFSNSKVNTFSQDENDIAVEERWLLKLQSQRKTNEKKKSRLLEEGRQFANTYNKVLQKQNRIQSDYDSKKHRLGGKPEATIYYENVVHYEYRGGLGFLDWCLGPKEVTRKEERKDYTAQTRWVEDERQIRNAYNHQKAELSAQLNSLKDGIGSTKQQSNRLDQTMSDDSVRIDRKKAIVLEMIESLKVKRTLAAKEYVQRQKDELRDSICVYLSNDLQQSLTDIINNEIKQIKDNLSLAIRNIYADFSRNQKHYLQQMLSENRSVGDISESIKQDMNDVLELKNTLEVYLCKQQMQQF